ncbi:FkbM family methyltransferase [Blastococcus haudaquaticus]|uniref:Methyltransferase, FkbM family n=1 Tax=Blastococcus haudaquaticus TaxID=1938745 RepID=A0A286H0E0_9ACTN|nr:FkbM family methyltransferase [Blastococcus haudaquaticus]SOE01211.1 methyltransferase, FkbM family [Blastococcus haudaquaticus]
MTAPRVSVLLVIRDGGTLLERALESIRIQRLDEAVEVVVADESSGDRALPVITAWSERATVEVRVLAGENRPGAALGLHRGFAACRGRYVAALADDDEWASPEELRRQVQLLDTQPHLSMAATGGSVHDSGPSAHVEVTARQLAQGDVAVTWSRATYRAEAVERLHPEIFETAAHDWLIALAMTGYGPVGLHPDAAPGHRAHQADVHELVPSHLHLLPPHVARELIAGTGAAVTRPDDAPAAPGVAVAEPDGARAIVVLDDYFPTKGTGFRIAEFDWMLRHGVVSEVMTTIEPLEPLITEYADLHPRTATQVSPYDPRRLADYGCASIMFLNNAAQFLDDLERTPLPFVLTLYPGGGLHLGEAAAERKLRRVLRSPQLRHVITTQPLVTDLVQTITGGSVPVTEVLGVVVDPGYLRSGPGLRTNYFGSGKPTLDVCFVAHRYTADGSDKGFPVFLESLRLLRDAGLPVRGHVVGGFGPSDLAGEHANLDLSFSGVLSTPELRQFYSGMDVIVSPTASGRLAPGAFDGFPTGACVEAALCGVALVATDPLNQNRLYTDGRDIHMPRADVVEVVARILDLVADPDGVRRVAQAGLRTTRQAYGVDAQLWSRRRVLEATRAAAHDHQESTPVADPLVSILVPTYNGERFLKAALRSALGQSHRNIEVIVGDDGSTDRTPDILAAVAAEDSRVRVLRFDPNIGPLENPRRLLAEARGEYVKYLMHDDVLGTDCVRELVRGMQQHPEATMAFSHRVRIDEQGRAIPQHEFPKLADRSRLLDGRELGNAVLLNCTNVIGEPTTVLFRRDDVSPDELWTIDGRTIDVLNDVQLWLHLLAKGPAYYTPRSLSRFRFHSGQNTHNPRYLGRGERDWSRLVDWGARHGFLAGDGQERRAQARALVEAANRLHQLIDTPDHGAALEAAFLSTAALVELTRPTPATRTTGLPERAHGPVVRDRLVQELDVWTREYPTALAAPALVPAEVNATVQALRELLAAGVSRQAMVAVHPADLDRAVPMLEDALSAGPDIDLELVPTEDPAVLLPHPWLAVVPRDRRWHHGRAFATWTFDLPDGAGTEQPGVTRFRLPDCQEILADLQVHVGDFSAMWEALTAAEFGRSGRRTDLLSLVGAQFVQDFERRRADVPPDRPYFTGTVAGGLQYMGDARDWPSALHAIDPGCNSTLIDALEGELSRRPGNYIDVGTNIGVVAASVAAHLAPGGQVFAFEPSPETLRLAASTIALNDAENVTLFNAAVSDTDGSLVFNATPGNSAIASARRHAFGLLNEWEQVTVPAVRLDTLYAAGELDGVTLLKVDVEGHEPSVLRGALEFIAAVRPTVVYEYTPVAAADHGWTQEDSIALLSRAGEFEFTALAESDGQVLPFPLPPGYLGQVNVFARPVPHS